MKNQSECVKVKVCLFKIISNYEIMSNFVSMSNEEFSRSNQCGSNQNIFESGACDSQSDTYSLLDHSGKLQSSSKNQEKTVRIPIS